MVNYLPPHKIVSFNIFRPRELAKYDLIIAFDDFFFVYIILSQQTERVRHSDGFVLEATLNN